MFEEILPTHWQNILAADNAHIFISPCLINNHGYDEYAWYLPGTNIIDFALDYLLEGCNKEAALEESIHFLDLYSLKGFTETPEWEVLAGKFLHLKDNPDSTESLTWKKMAEIFANFFNKIIGPSAGYTADDESLELHGQYYTGLSFYGGGKVAGG